MINKNNILPIDRKPTEHVQDLLRHWKHCTNILPVHDTSVRNIAADVCTLLVKTKSFDALSVFLEALPDIYEYNCDENVVRAKIHVALYKGDTEKVYKLIEDSLFSDGEDLIKIWDEAHYADEKVRTRKEPTPLSKFRVRKRYPPPKSICPSGIRKTNSLPRDATSYLKTWLMNHLNDPYPSSDEKQQLSQISGLSSTQVKTWFANARRRSKNSDEFRRRCELFRQSAALPNGPDKLCLSTLPFHEETSSSSSPSSFSSHGGHVVNNQNENTIHQQSSHVNPYYEYLHYAMSSNTYVYEVLVLHKTLTSKIRCGRTDLLPSSPSYQASCTNAVRLCRPLEQTTSSTTNQIDARLQDYRNHHDYLYGPYYH